MNGYGQPMVTPEQYGQALQAFDALQRRQDVQQGIARTGNPYALLGAALSGMAANKFGKYKDTNITDASEQIRQFQEQKAAELEQIKQAKAQREAEAKRKQDLADKQAERDFQMKKMMAGKEFDVANRAAPQAGFNERIYNSMSPEQKQAYINKMTGAQQQGGMFNQEEQALIQAGAVTPEQLIDVKKKDALGIKDQKAPTGEAKNKLGLLETAERDLLKYMDQAFKDGDYQEIGSKFGSTDALFKSAVMNALRAESGAAIGKDEIKNFEDTYGASMFRSDETNAARVQGLLEKIRTQKAALAGGNMQKQPTQQQGLSDNELYNKY